MPAQLLGFTRVCFRLPLDYLVQNFAFPIVITAGFNVFSCTAQPIAGVTYLTQDLTLACGTPTHRIMQIIGAIAIALAGAGIPLLFALTLYRRRRQLYNYETFSSLGFLYNGYDVARGRYAFESLVMLRKAGAVFIGNTVSDPSMQLTSTLLMMVLMTVLQLMLRPFAVSLWSALDTLSLVSVLVTLVASIMYLRWSTPAHTCEVLSDTDVLPGTITTCAEVRTELARTNIGVSVVLLIMHLSVALVFAATMLTLWRVRAHRAALRAALAKSMARRPSPQAGPDASATAGAAQQEQEEAVRRVVSSLVASAHTPGSAAGCWSRVTSCCRAYCSAAGTGPDASASPSGVTRRSSLARRVSAAAAQFIKQKSSSRAIGAASNQAAAAVTPHMVTRAALTLQARLDAPSASTGRSTGRACGCCCICFAQRVKQPILAAVHAAAESSEQTTDLIRSSALSPAATEAVAAGVTAKSDPHLLALTRGGGAAAARGAVAEAGGSESHIQQAALGSNSSEPVRLRAEPSTPLRSIRALNPQWAVEQERGRHDGGQAVPAAALKLAPARAEPARLTSESRGAVVLMTANPLADYNANDSVFTASDRAAEVPRAVFTAIAVGAADDSDVRSASGASTASSGLKTERLGPAQPSDSEVGHQLASSDARTGSGTGLRAGPDSDAAAGPVPPDLSREVALFRSRPVPSRSRRSLASGNVQGGC